jgi:hypothetical protein
MGLMRGLARHRLPPETFEVVIGQNPRYAQFFCYAHKGRERREESDATELVACFGLLVRAN